MGTIENPIRSYHDTGYKNEFKKKLGHTAYLWKSSLMDKGYQEKMGIFRTAFLGYRVGHLLLHEIEIYGMRFGNAGEG